MFLNIKVTTYLLLICAPVSPLRSQGILHSFSGTDTDRIWPYINSLLSTKMQTQPLATCQTQTPWHYCERKDHRETSRGWQRKSDDVSTSWPRCQVPASSLTDWDTNQICSLPTWVNQKWVFKCTVVCNHQELYTLDYVKFTQLFLFIFNRFEHSY